MRQLKITKSITNRESQSLDKYLQEIGREELITAEQEVELAQRIKQGDQVALEKLTIGLDLLSPLKSLISTKYSFLILIDNMIANIATFIIM